VLAGQRGDSSRRDVCRQDEIAETLYYQGGGLAAGRREGSAATPRDKQPEEAELAELRKRVGQVERALGRKTYELGGRGVRGAAVPRRRGHRLRRGRRGVSVGAARR
jgi:hypothetical protein